MFANKYRPIGKARFRLAGEEPTRTLLAIDESVTARRLSGKESMTGDQSGDHSHFTLRLPNSLRAAAKELAVKEGVSLNQFISLAIVEKISRVERQGTSSTAKRVKVLHSGRGISS